MVEIVRLGRALEVVLDAGRAVDGRGVDPSLHRPVVVVGRHQILLVEGEGDRHRILTDPAVLIPVVDALILTHADRRQTQDRTTES